MNQLSFLARGIGRKVRWVSAALWLGACAGEPTGSTELPPGPPPDNTHNDNTSNPPTNPPPPTRGWNGGEQVSPSRTLSPYGYRSLHAVAARINDAGTGIALWDEESSEPESYLWVNVYRSGSWGSPTPLGGKGASGSGVAIAPNGDAIALWTQRRYDGTGSSSNVLHAARYAYASGTWSAPEQVNFDSATDPHPDAGAIAQDASGNVIVLWTQDNQVWARRYLPASGWEASATQLSNSTNSIYDVQLVVDENNVFTAAWTEDTTLQHAVPHARRFASGSWSARERIGLSDADVTSGAIHLRLDVNAAGRVFAVWAQTRKINGSSESSVNAAWFAPTTSTWNAPQLVANGDFLSFPQVAVDRTGNALAVFERDARDSDAKSVRAARFTAANGTWGSEQLIDETGTGGIFYPVLGADAAGNAEVVWREDGKGLVERRFDVGTGSWGGFNTHTPWGSHLLLDMSDNGYALLLGDDESFSSTGFTLSLWGWVYTPGE